MARGGTRTPRIEGQASGGGPGGRTANSWLQGLACGALVTFAPAYALLAGVLMAPTAIAFLLDRRPGRPVLRTVFLAGAAFTLAPVWRLLQTGQGIAGALDLLADAGSTGLAWVAGAAGWATCELLPVLFRVGLDLGTAQRTASLQAEAKSLRESWDLEG